MNSLLNDVQRQKALLKKNLKNFAERFPALERSLRLQAETFPCAAVSRSGDTDNRFDAVDNDFGETDSDFGANDNDSREADNRLKIFEAKNGEITASYKDLLLHSRYNPSNEAAKTLHTEFVTQAESLVFFGSGLGYGQAEAAQSFPSKNLIVIEPDPLRLLQAFSVFDWEAVFKVPSCVFLVGADTQAVISVLEHYGLRDAAVIAPKACTAHAETYFSALASLIARNKDKQDINEKTLQKFGTLWLSNMCKNLARSMSLNGINRYKDGAPHLPFCILAAGPSLDEILPHLREVKKRAVLVCTDTALRSCLRVGVQPHFILVTDPQYLNARHIADLKAPESILITETAVYPDIFRFKCREIILYSSLFPLGRYIEQFGEKKESLAAGGSVASSAWDFARFCGAKIIYTAGLDLSYPANKTHARGSTFEEKTHFISHRLKGTEMHNAAAVYTNPAYTNDNKAADYEGNPVITDARMLLYAWWFESKAASFPDVKTASLSAKSLCIPGFFLANVCDLLSLPIREKEIDDFCFSQIAGAENLTDTPSPRRQKEDNKTDALNSLQKDLCELQNTVKQAAEVCGRRCRTEADYTQVLNELSRIDELIYKSRVKALASLVFPPPSQLESIAQKSLPPAPPPPPRGDYKTAAAYNILKSKLIYTIILQSIDTHIHYLKKNGLFL